MEEKVLKLMARLGLLALIVWVIAAAMGRREDAQIQPPKRKPWRTSNVWATSPVSAPSAERMTFQTAIIPMQAV